MDRAGGDQEMIVPPGRQPVRIRACREVPAARLGCAREAAAYAVAIVAVLDMDPRDVVEE